MLPPPIERVVLLPLAEVAAALLGVALEPGVDFEPGDGLAAGADLEAAEFLVARVLDAARVGLAAARVGRAAAFGAGFGAYLALAGCGFLTGSSFFSTVSFGGSGTGSLFSLLGSVFGVDFSSFYSGSGLTGVFCSTGSGSGSKSSTSSSSTITFYFHSRRLRR